MSHVLDTPAQLKRGSIHKCPSCGAALGAFVSSCESCGHEFMDVDANRSIAALAERFDEIERELGTLSLNAKQKEQQLVERKSRVIRDFPVPNSRDDLQQLIYYIQPRIVASVKPDPNIEDWRVKFAEVLNRAKNAYKNDAAALVEFDRIEQSLNKSLKENIQIKAKRNPLFFVLLGGAVLLGAGAFVSSQIERAELQQCEQAYDQAAADEKTRLESLYAAIEKDIAARDFAAAQIKTGRLRWEHEAGCKAAETENARTLWSDKAGQLAALIQGGAEREAAAQTEAMQREAANEQAAAQRVTDERIAEQQKVAELARIQAAREQAAAAKAASEQRKATVETQW